MQALLLQAVVEALRADTPQRFLRSERGYQGRFYCALQEALDRRGVLKDGIILEMEYQKSSRHNMNQRPDIILHIPAEESRSGVQANNFMVIALKRRASSDLAKEDFDKLDQMCGQLRYSLAVFINIDCADHHLDRYTGDFADRIHAFAIECRRGSAKIIHAWRDGASPKQQEE